MTDTSLRILLVEDSPSDAQVLRETLQSAGHGRFEFTLAERLDEALERVHKEHFDVLLLDLSLPDTTGAETFLRARAQAPQTPIVVLTGAGSESLGLEAVRHGIQDYLIKGQTDGRQIARSIRYAIERKQTEEDLRAARDGLEIRVQERTADLFRANKALRESEAHMRLFLEQTPAIFWSTDRDLSITASLGKGLMAMNLAPGQAVGMKAGQYLERAGEPSSEIRAAHLRALAREPVNYEFGAHGNFFQAHVEPLQDQNGEVIGCIGIALDVTEQRRAARELSELHKEIAELSTREQRRIGQELHDSLGQQLTGIGMLAKRLHRKMEAKSLTGSEEAGELVSLIREAQRQTRALSRGLMPVEMDAGGLMTALEEMTQRAAETSGVRCRFECERPVSVEDSDVAVHLFRIAQEAVHNAIRHGRPGNAVVSLEESRGCVVLEVRDDGAGIRGGSQSGGLGLRIMRYRADVMGADLVIASPEGGGTIVTCSMKREKTHGKTQAEGTARAQDGQETRGAQVEDSYRG